MTPRSATVTFLFTDIVSSTEILQDLGDRAAQRVFKAHHRQLAAVIEANDGREVKWLGDGQMAAFASAGDAVRCAIWMQQSMLRPSAGVRLGIRVGLHIGEVQIDGDDYFGSPVVVARRLCDRAAGGQILASDLIARLVGDSGADVLTRDLGTLELKGIAAAVPIVEIVYDLDPMALLRHLPFVGRDVELAGLVRRFEAACVGRGSIVTVAGEPGIGKSRLGEEFCEHVAGEAIVIRGDCFEGDGAAPFGPWSAALRSLVDQLPADELDTVLGADAAGLSLMLPELRDRLVGGELSTLDPESARARLFDGVAALLARAAQWRPILVVLEDLHWADRPSLALLDHVMRGVARQRIVLVVTYRDVEVDRHHALAPTLAAVHRQEHHHSVVLRGFSPQSVHALLRAIEPGPEAEIAGRALGDVLSAETDGNPLFIREVLNHLVETGKLVRQGGAWVAAVDTIDEMQIPDGIKEVVGRRVGRLSDGCRSMLQRTSALASGFTWAELCAISDEPEHTLMDALDEALDAHLVVEGPPLSYAFTHAVIRATLYGELSSPRRARLHLRVAESFEVLYADELDDHLGELAAHFLTSMGPGAAKGLDYSVRAADRAFRLTAWEEAGAHYQRALDVMGSEVDVVVRCSALLSLGDSNLNAGQFVPALDAFRRAADAAELARRADLGGEAVCGFAEAALLSDGAPAAERLSRIDSALEAIGPTDSVLRARLLAARAAPAQAMLLLREGDALRSAGWGSYSGTKDPEIVRQCREAVAIAERLGDPAVTAQTMSELFWYLDGPGAQDERQELARRTITNARRAGNGRLECSAWNGLFSTCLLEGDATAARDAHDEGSRRADELRLTRAQYVTRIQAGTLLTMDGRFDQAEAEVTGAFEFGTSLDDAIAPLAFGAQLTRLRWCQGRAAELEPTWRAFTEASPNVATYRGLLASVLAGTGHHDEADAVLDDLIASGFASLPQDGFWTTAMVVVTLAFSKLGRTDGTAELYETFRSHGARVAVAGNAVVFGATATFLGMLSSLLERWDEAERHFEAGCALDQRMGNRPALVDGQKEHAEMLLRRGGDDARAVRLLGEALAGGQEMSMPTLVADAQQLLAVSSRSEMWRSVQPEVGR